MVLRPSPAVVVAALSASAAMHGALLLLPAGSSGSTTETAPVRVSEIAIDWSEVPEPPDSVLAPATGHVAVSPNVRAPRRERRVAVEAPSPPAQASPATATTTVATGEMPRFTIAIGATPGAFGSVSPAGSAPSTAHEAEDRPLPEAQVDGKARLVFGLSPSYPEAARSKGAEGDVQLELVVGTAGAVESAYVVEGVDRALDEAALQAAERFRFAPATKSGLPVRVRMRWSIEFRLN